MNTLAGNEIEFSEQAVARRIVEALSCDPMLLTHGRAFGLHVAAQGSLINAISQVDHVSAKMIAANLNASDRMRGALQMIADMSPASSEHAREMVQIAQAALTPEPSVNDEIIIEIMGKKSRSDRIAAIVNRATN